MTYHRFVPQIPFEGRPPEDRCRQCGNARGTVYHSEPRGLARLDSTGLAQLTEIFLTVIDDGWQCSSSCDLRHPWIFNSADEDLDRNEEEFDNKQRLRFADAVRTAIIAKTTPAAQRPETPMSDPDHLRPDKGGNKASDDYW